MGKLDDKQKYSAEHEKDREPHKDRFAVEECPNTNELIFAAETGIAFE
jgi:hypothetical protein